MHILAPHHRRFLGFAFKGVAYQYTVLRFGLPLTPCTFMECMDAAISPLRQMGVCILNSSVDGSENLRDIWQGLRREVSLPDLLFEGRGCVGPWMAQPPPLCIPPDRPVSRIKERGHKVLLMAPLWINQHWPSELTQLLIVASWPIPLIRYLLSQANGTIWHPRPDLWALHFGCSTGARKLLRKHAGYNFWG